MAPGKKTSRNAGKSTLRHKSRRHKRTSLASSTMTRGRCGTSASASFFHGLPAEVVDLILDKLSLLEISVFSMVSKEMNRYVVGYISTLPWKSKMINQSFHQSICLEQKSIAELHRHLGLLFKRCTLLLPTTERLKFIFSKFSQLPCFRLEQCVVPVCTSLSSYGIFLQTLIAGWDKMEWQRVFNFLCHTTNLLQKTEAVINTKPGVRRYQELQLRLFCRQVLLDPWLNQPQCHYWLLQLLKPWPPVSQACLLFILYGPLQSEGTLGWQDVVERVLPLRALCDLATTVFQLHRISEVKGRTPAAILTILEELTEIPQPWHVENVARFLLLCGNNLTYIFVASKALNGRLHEACRLIVYIILVSEKDGLQMSWIANLLHQICTLFGAGPEKFCFIQTLENTFSDITRDFFELSLAEMHYGNREAFQNLCVLLLSSTRFHTEFLHTLLNDAD